jgi:ABC-2 type transport system permease protein
MQLVFTIIGAIYGLGCLVLVGAGLVALSFTSIEFARTISVFAGAAVILGWTILPVLTSGIDQTVEPSRLATFPIPLDTLLVGLTVSGVLGIPGIITLVAALTTAATWWHHPLAALAAIPTAIIGVLTAVVGSRMLVALSARIGSGRRVRETKGLLVFIPLLLLGPIIFLLTQVVRSISDLLPTIASVIAWTPFGAIWAVPGDVAAGESGRAGLELLIGLATLVVFWMLWRWGLARALETTPRATSVRSSARGLGLFGMFPGTPTGAVAARALTYWIRDPRYAQSLIMIPLVPVLVLFWAGVNGNFGTFPFVGPIVAVLLAVSIYTDVSYDNTAFALHLQTGVSGRADRLGRVIALAVFAIPVTVVFTIGGIALSGQWHLLLGMLGIVAGILLSGFGVSSVMSGRFAFPVPAPGESPFKSRPGGGVSLLLSSLVTWSVVGVLVLPELGFAVASFVTGDVLWGWIALVLGIALGMVFLVVGVRVGGAILDRRGPDLFAQLQRQK